MPGASGNGEPAEDHARSGTLMRCLGDTSGLLDVTKMWQWRRCYSPERGRDILAAGVGEEAELERIREATRAGRPLGSPDFIRDLGLRIGRSLERRKAGRPPKDALDKVEAAYLW
jgi:hypothetical protein